MGMLATILISAGTGGLAGALFTFGAQAVVRWWNRPRVVFLPYEHRAPMYRLAPDASTGRNVFYVNIGVRNRGCTIAERCRAVVTAMAAFKQDQLGHGQELAPFGLKVVGLSGFGV